MESYVNSIYYTVLRRYAYGKMPSHFIFIDRSSTHELNHANYDDV